MDLLGLPDHDGSKSGSATGYLDSACWSVSTVVPLIAGQFESDIAPFGVALAGSVFPAVSAALWYRETFMTESQVGLSWMWTATHSRFKYEQPYSVTLAPILLSYLSSTRAIFIYRKALLQGLCFHG